MEITKSNLTSCKFENVLRLARFLRLKKLDSMSERQIAALVAWRLSSARYLDREWRN